MPPGVKPSIAGAEIASVVPAKQPWWSTAQRYIQSRIRRAMLRREASVTGMSFGRPVVPLVVANIRTGPLVSTFASPCAIRSTYGSKPSYARTATES